ncbi:hypothetical protein [Nocardia carnea]|uniref:hypothetical protein n=1 Tax=Nocardia carnea TaxID=37328 RepID=UPI0024539697|nr:hypothetical protein [Nocardia carnea]
MTGTAESVREPKTDAELARDLDRRLKSLENSTSLRCGPWVFSASDDGHLIASHVEGGSVIVARKPPPGENDPDAIEDATPAVVLIRSDLQAIPATGAIVQWDGVLAEIGGDWTSGARTLESVAVPVSGIYRITCTLHWSQGSLAAATGIQIDGETMLAGRFVESSGVAWPSSIAVGDLPLEAGAGIAAYALPGAPRSIGGSALGSPPIPCMLSVSLIARK